MPSTGTRGMMRITNITEAIVGSEGYDVPPDRQDHAEPRRWCTLVACPSPATPSRRCAPRNRRAPSVTSRWLPGKGPLTCLARGGTR